MANIVITNNGTENSPEIPANPDLGIEYRPATQESASIKITDAQGNQIVLKPNTSQGLPLGVYTIEVVNG